MMAAMLEGPDPTTRTAPNAGDAMPIRPDPGDSRELPEMREMLARLQADLKSKQIKIEALNFEIARLKRWRFGSSSESLDASAQAVLFEQILADTRIEHHHEIDGALCGCGEPLRRIGEESPSRPYRPEAAPLHSYVEAHVA